MSACASLTGLSDFPWAPVWLFPPPHVGCPIPSSQTWHHQAWPSHSWAHGCHEDVVRLPQAHWSSNPFASLLSHPVMAGHFPVLQVGSRTQVSPPLRSPNLLCMGGFLSIAPLHTMGQDQVQGPDQCLTPGPSSQLSHQFWAWRIYFFFFFLAVLGLHCCTRAFSSCGEPGLLFAAVHRFLTEVASLVAQHRL